VVGIALELANTPSVVRRIVRRHSAAAEALEMEIADPGLLQQSCQVLRFGPRHVPRPWEAADIDEQLNLLISKNFNEL
jgi:hypothetical protein